MPNLLILTVGTGTAGRYSSIAEGLRRTIELISPRAFWLVPSTHSDSIAVADLVREGFATFRPSSSEERYSLLSAPDDLEQCRQTLRSMIAEVRRELRSGEKLLVNPTSGTKQMTAAATLASLDEGIGEILFTVGERSDGVVKTGTERLTSFDAANYFRDRDLTQAREALELGAFAASEHFLRPHRVQLVREHAIAECLVYWQRQDYVPAATAAARFDEALRRHLSALADDVARAHPSAGVVADLLAWADHFIFIRDADTSLGLSYKALELAARLRLHELTGTRPPYPLAEVRKWRITTGLHERLRSMSRHGDSVFFGLNIAMQTLQEMDDSLGHAFFADAWLRKCVQERNDLVHAVSPASPENARRLFAQAHGLLVEELALPVPPARPKL